MWSRASAQLSASRFPLAQQPALQSRNAPHALSLPSLPEWWHGYCVQRPHETFRNGAVEQLAAVGTSSVRVAQTRGGGHQQTLA